ncbi:MAG: glycosyltransferase family 2 protein [Prevotella sp.]|jgi:GT2 family glycosyltransferase
MEKLIDIFLPMAERDIMDRTLQSVHEQNYVNRVVLMAGENCATEGVLSVGPLRSSQTMRRVAEAAEAPYTLLYLKEQTLNMGYLSTDRLLQVAEMTGAVMIYSDHYNVSAEGLRSDAPVIDYQQGALRDDFDFGSLILLRTADLKAAAAEMTTDYQAAGFYDLRLRLSRRGSLVHIPEPLYSEVELDNRKSGEKLFDYVNPRNRQAQIEMEQVCTEHLKAVGGYLAPHFEKVDLNSGEFTVEASVMIPVRNRIRTIRDAIRSALSQQTNFKFNVFVVENGPECHSTDGTTEAIDEFKTDSRLVHLIPKRNDIGVGGAWNMAAHHPQCGRFLVQLDSDDVYSGPDSLQKMVDTFRQQQCAMVIGSYRLTDIDGNILPPGKIDHREWTPENGRNNALRINGLGAPRAFFTPILRQINLPNVIYGEDYALGLALSRYYQIGRLYDVVYNCRRWDDNSDGDLTIEKNNRYNTYKDRIRTWELQARIAMNKKA